VLDNDIVALLLVFDAQVAEKGVGRFAHDHCGKELASKPRSAT
jgi:hypothetical protein